MLPIYHNRFGSTPNVMPTVREHGNYVAGARTPQPAPVSNLGQVVPEGTPKDVFRAEYGESIELIYIGLPHKLADGIRFVVMSGDFGDLRYRRK